MKSLSPLVVTHDDLSAHQGPEPSFIRNGVGGLRYDHRNPEEYLYQAIKELAKDHVRLASMQQVAFEDYRQLVNPSLATRFWSIISEGRDALQTGFPAAQPGTSKSSAQRLPRDSRSSSA